MCNVMRLWCKLLKWESSGYGEFIVNFLSGGSFYVSRLYFAFGVIHKSFYASRLYFPLGVIHKSFYATWLYFPLTMHPLTLTLSRWNVYPQNPLLWYIIRLPMWKFWNFREKKTPNRPNYFFDFPIIGPKKVVVNFIYGYQTLSGEKCKSNGKRISSIRHTSEEKNPKNHPKIPYFRKVVFSNK